MIQMEGGDRLRRVTLLDRMSTTTVDTNRSSLTGLTLEAILLSEKNVTSPSPPQILLSPSPPPPPPSTSSNHSNRTLLDVMQREHRHNRHSTAWKSLREKLRLKHNATTVWISANPIPSSDTPIPNRDNENRQLGFLLSSTGNVTTEEASSAEGRVRLGAVLAEERALSAREEETLVEREVEPARMSLMELLEENEEPISFVNVEGEAEETVTVTPAEISCCVCMVRSKGAAFIPCGHTFCRLCSRELWVQRGNCPLCNTTILEVLDLF